MEVFVNRHAGLLPKLRHGASGALRKGKLRRISGAEQANILTCKNGVQFLD
jgi:hypothetical protein